MLVLTADHRVLARGYYWRIEVLRSWPPQRNAALKAYLSAVAEAQESISLCKMVRTAVDIMLARPADTTYVCQPLIGYLYPESQRSAIPTDSHPSEDGVMIAMILEIKNQTGIVHQWRLTKMTGSEKEPDRLN